MPWRCLSRESGLCCCGAAVVWQGCVDAAGGSSSTVRAKKSSKQRPPTQHTEQHPGSAAEQLTHPYFFPHGSYITLVRCHPTHIQPRGSFQLLSIGCGRVRRSEHVTVTVATCMNTLNILTCAKGVEFGVGSDHSGKLLHPLAVLTNEPQSTSCTLYSITRIRYRRAC